MGPRYFGTDGIRGVAGQPPLTPGFVLRLGRALGRLRPGTIVVGRDTRRSSPALRDAMAAGMLAEGARVVDIGVLPTPAVSAEVLRLGADAGVMITASHNPFRDNGIKVFGSDGTKLDDDDELRIEALVDEVDPDASAPEIGRAEDGHEAARGALLERAATGTPWGRGLRIAVDSAHGAASPVAAPALAMSGATVVDLAARPDGDNINEGCGALHPERLCERVRRGDADLGVALDGDADRCLLVGEDGELIDGDVLIALLALHRGLDRVVGTVMTNEGVVRHLADRGVEVFRAPVGDRNVLLRMREEGAVLGGESSGHIIMLDRGPAGDGLATARAALELRYEAGRPLAELAAGIQLFPSSLKAVRVGSKPPLEDQAEIQEAIAASEARMDGAGRVLLRYSGTEPVLRVFVEGADRDLVNEICDELVRVAERALGGQDT